MMIEMITWLKIAAIVALARHLFRSPSVELPKDYYKNDED